jgi:hypothetical protein
VPAGGGGEVAHPGRGRVCNDPTKVDPDGPCAGERERGSTLPPGDGRLGSVCQRKPRPGGILLQTVEGASCLAQQP